jgi:hypothetical protein
MPNPSQQGRCELPGTASYRTQPLTHHTQLIQPCALPATQGGNGTCTTADLVVARPIISDMCAFFNATLYESYSGCPQELSKEKTYALIGNSTITARSDTYNATHALRELEQRNYTRRGFEQNYTQHGFEQRSAQHGWNYTRRSVEQGSNTTEHGLKQRSTHGAWNATRRAAGWNSTDSSA